MNNSNQLYKNTLDDIEADGLYKKERIITTPQSVKIKTNNEAKIKQVAGKIAYNKYM